jgi:glycine/D-amino acid oxidase-like deaminating enzyme
VLAGIGKPMTELRLADLPRHFPQLDTRGVERAFWTGTGGVLFARDIAAALARHLAQKPGARLHSDTPVRTVDLEQARVVVESGAIHDADIVVVAAGAWVGRLLPRLGRRLIPSRQIVAYFDLPGDQRAAWATGPMIIDKTGDVGLYLAPPAEGRGLKIGDHAFSLSLLKGFERWRIDRLKSCFYTVTDDERFVVEKQGARGWVMSPCSGHGFKFGAVMGLELAHTIVASRDPAAHARWGPVWKAISRPDRMS